MLTLLTIRNKRGAIVLARCCQRRSAARPVLRRHALRRRSLAHDGVNVLMPAAFDPVSKQPELGHAAVRIEAADLPWRLTLLRSASDGPNADEQVLTWRSRLEPMLGDFGYAALTLDGRERPLVALRLAVSTPLTVAQIEAITSALDMPNPPASTTATARATSSSERSLRAGRLTGILLGGEDRRQWLAAHRAARRHRHRRTAPLAVRPTFNAARRGGCPTSRDLQLLRRQRRRDRNGSSG